MMSSARIGHPLCILHSSLGGYYYRCCQKTVVPRNIQGLLQLVSNTGKRRIWILEKFLQIATGRGHRNKGTIRHHSMEISQRWSSLMLCHVLKFKRYCSLTCFPWLEFITVNRSEPWGKLLDMHWQEQTVTAWKITLMSLRNQSLGGGGTCLPYPRQVLFTNWLEGQQFLSSWLSSVRVCLYFPLFSCTHRKLCKGEIKTLKFQNPQAGHFVCVCMYILRRTVTHLKEYFFSPQKTEELWNDFCKLYFSDTSN